MAIIPLLDFKMYC